MKHRPNWPLWEKAKNEELETLCQAGIWELVFTGQVRSGHLPKSAMTATGQMTADSKKS